MKYNAFISYSHTQDSDLAPHLETALEKFAKPLFKLRALHVFRDANDLSASPDLWGKIEEGLHHSEYFIFLASPKAAQSRWCKKEVEFWKANKNINNFLVVLTDGELAWDESTSDFDWNKTTAIPDNLSGVFKNEPLYVDFRNHNNAELGLEYPDFKTKTVLLAATIHGRSVGDMIGENMKQHKKTLRIRNGAIAVLSALLITVGAAGFYANEQKKEAIEQTKIALLSSYISNSQVQLNQDPTKALRLAEYAYKFAKTNGFETEHAEDQLIKVFYSGNGFYQEPNFETPNFNKKNITEIDDIRLVRTKSLGYYGEGDLSDNNTICGVNFVEVDKNNNTKFNYELDFEYCNIRFSEDGKYLLYDLKDGLKYSTYISERGSNKKIDSVNGDTETNLPVVISLGETIILAGGNLNRPQLMLTWIEKNSYTPNKYEINLKGFQGQNGLILDAAISSDERYSVLGSFNGKIGLVDNTAFVKRMYTPHENFKTRAFFMTENKSRITRVLFSKSDEFVYSLNADNQTYKWKVKPFPYLEIGNQKYEPDWDNALSTGYDLTTKSKDIRRFSWNAYDLIDPSGKQIAHFPERDYSGSPDFSKGRFIGNTDALKNRNNDILIELNRDTDDLRTIFEGFSDNGKFFGLFYHNSISQIFGLDPEYIIARLNNPEFMGRIAHLSDADKKRFLISEEDISDFKIHTPQLKVESNKISDDAQTSDTKLQTNGNNPSQAITSEQLLATITVDSLRVRTAPNLNSETLTFLPIDTNIELTENRSQNQTTVLIKGSYITDYWYNIKTSDGIIGWIHGCCFDKSN